MEKLLTAYLFQYKNCPLPGIGGLTLYPGHAEFLPGQKRMLAPVPYIGLTEKALPSDNLVTFIAAQKNLKTSEAADMLEQFCQRIGLLRANEELSLASSGSFYKDSNETLNFKTVPLPSTFFPEVTAERVIHPDVVHNILVGDQETNSTIMTERLNYTEGQVRSRWWIAALILGLIGIAGLVIYFSQYAHGGLFGNVKPVSPRPYPKTYVVPDK